ncbi:hypothetical protein GMB70_14550 [Turicibacter sanguinis]|nr:hypothetical protein [Turicibacter sanguinis]
MVEAQLKELILSRYKSLRAFTIEIDIPYSTIDTMLKRGIGGASVTTVLKVCKALEIDADELSEGRITSKSNLMQSKIKEDDEEKILYLYRQLDSYGKEMIFTILNKELERIKSQQSAH